MSSSSNTSLNIPAVTTRRGDGGKPNRLDLWAARTMLSSIGDPPFCLILWDRTRVQPDNVKPRFHIVFHDRGALWQVFTRPAVKFGDCYSTGRIEVQENLVEFLDALYLQLQKSPRSRFTQTLIDLGQRSPRNTLSRARRNIQHHYDLGNEFYARWLDREMQYTCAYFPDPAYSLEQAQVAKMHHVCRKLMLQPGQKVVEAGCGWGGLARFMAREYGVTVESYNISREQIAYARQRAAEQGLEDRVTYVADDYRNIRGEFDVFVSVGMLEHVGLDNYPELGRVIDACLRPQGMGLIHSIGRNRPMLMNAWIEQRIFPGARPPSISQMMEVFEPRNLSILDIENLRLHYSTTLEHWLSRFEDNAGEIRQDYDEHFVRAWRLYLSGSISAFNVGALQLFQVVFARGRNNTLPWSREHLYSHDKPAAE